MNQPNVILLTLDTLRADMLSCYGYKTRTTPHIDRLAEKGLRFDQAITGGSWTQAAFPVLMTSTYASMYGGCLGPLSPERPSPIEALAKHGYTTAGFSTGPLLSRSYGYARGFETFVDLVPDESDPPLRHLKGGERLLRIPITHYVSGLVGKRTRPARLYVSADQLTNRVCQWLDRVEGPFFSWVHFMDIHWPYHREETLTYPQEIAQAWKDLAHYHGVNWNGLTITDAHRARYMNLYEQALQYTDAQIGRLLEYLNKSGRLSNTVIIIVSDHGEEFLERGRWGHFETNLYDEILKVPLIIYLPDLPAGQIIQKQVRTLDIMPTILDICGCPIPPRVEGSSLRPLWARTGFIYDAPISISEMWRDERHIIAVRTEKYKYIWDSRQPNKPLLFDLQTDPGEQHNVIEQYPAEAQTFQSHVEAHLERATAAAMAVADFELDEEITRRLRDLGYVE